MKHFSNFSNQTLSQMVSSGTGTNQELTSADAARNLCPSITQSEDRDDVGMSHTLSHKFNDTNVNMEIFDTTIKTKFVEQRKMIKS